MAGGSGRDDETAVDTMSAVLFPLIALVFVVIYNFNYRWDFRQDPKRAKHAFRVILPIFLSVVYLLYLTFIPLVVLLCSPLTHLHRH